ncbi:DUF1501 domain-containing protein [Chloroflexi bacterium TSY]|nr:DUF1501 domain-containing protein [Chloroflexi bacterium TSY]
MNEQINRREFLGTMSAVGVLGASKAIFPSWMPKMAFRSEQERVYAPGDVLVCIFLRGGIDGISAVVPYSEGAAYYDARPTLAVAEPGQIGGAIDLDGQFGLHPSLAPLKDIYTEEDLLIVHATGLTDPSRSHFDAMQFMEAGAPGDKTVETGWIGRHLQTAAWENDSPFRAVGMGALVPASLRGPVSPLSIQSIADFHFQGREDELLHLQQSLASLYTIDAPTDQLAKQANLVFETIATLEKLDATNYQPANGAVYPIGEFGLGLRQTAQLIKADVGLEVSCIDLGGWDTHEGQGTLDGEYNQLVTTLGQGLSALYADLGDRMQNVCVVTMSEFGRRIDENGSQGTDHGHGNVVFLMGDGVRGGKVFARWPTLASNALADGDLAITTDYRDVLAEVVQHRLGNPAIGQVFPNHRVELLGLVDPISESVDRNAE